MFSVASGVAVWNSVSHNWLRFDSEAGMTIDETRWSKEAVKFLSCIAVVESHHHKGGRCPAQTGIWEACNR